MHMANEEERMGNRKEKMGKLNSHIEIVTNGDSK